MDFTNFQTQRRDPYHIAQSTVSSERRRSPQQRDGSVRHTEHQNHLMSAEQPAARTFGDDDRTMWIIRLNCLGFLRRCRASNLGTGIRKSCRERSCAGRRDLLFLHLSGRGNGLLGESRRQTRCGKYGRCNDPEKAVSKPCHVFRPSPLRSAFRISEKSVAVTIRNQRRSWYRRRRRRKAAQ
jgi:hypothetical protein